MKKLPKLLTVFLLAVAWGAFSIPEASAVTVYQQFSDSSGEVETNAGCRLVGSFTVSQSVLISPISIQSVIRREDAFTGNNPFNWAIGTSSTDCNAPNRFITATPRSMDGSVLPTNQADVFSLATSTATPVNGVLSYEPGTTYYVWADSGITDVFILMNLGRNFFYGYVTAGSLTPSLPIHPDIPGYTDVGIDVTAQQTYCNANFSTSTSLLEGVGSSIALGFCNVGVFLFIPSSGALNAFSALASTTQTKIPFSYYYNVKTILESATSTSGNFTAMSLNLGGATGVGSTSPFAGVLNQDFQLLSTSTISTYISPSTYSLLMDLARYAIWIAVMFHLYRRIVPKHANI